MIVLADAYPCMRSRPTAVNLQDACQMLERAAAEAAAVPEASPHSVVEAVVAAGEAYFESDIATCKVGFTIAKFSRMPSYNLFAHYLACRLKTASLSCRPSGATALMHYWQRQRRLGEGMVASCGC